MHTVPNEEYRLKKRRELLEKYKELEAFRIGKSILSRDIDCYKIGKGRRAILAVGAHHALEYISSLAIYDFIDFLLEKTTRPRTFCNISLDFLLDSYSYYLIPALNADGIELVNGTADENVLYERQKRQNGSDDFSEWQANGRGVDLNHNYDWGFAEYKKIEEREGIAAGRTRYSGEYPESEPETRSLASLVRTLMPIAVVSLHTQGREIFYAPEAPRIAKSAQRLAHSVGYTVAERDGHNSYGGFCDYTGNALGIPSFTVELGRGKSPLPDSARAEVSLATRKILVSLPSVL